MRDGCVMRLFVCRIRYVDWRVHWTSPIPLLLWDTPIPLLLWDLRVLCCHNPECVCARESLFSFSYVFGLLFYSLDGILPSLGSFPVSPPPECDVW
jgi:hypothetical protein